MEKRVDELYDDYVDKWISCVEISEEIADNISLEKIASEASKKIVLKGTDAAAIGLGGKGAVLTIGGHTIGAWAGTFVGLVYVYDLGYSSVSGIECFYEWADNYSKYKEARCILDAREHPEKTSFDEDCSETVSNWVEIEEIDFESLVFPKDEHTETIEEEENLEVESTEPDSFGCNNPSLTPEERINCGAHKYYATSIVDGECFVTCSENQSGLKECSYMVELINIFSSEIVERKVEGFSMVFNKTGKNTYLVMLEQEYGIDPLEIVFIKDGIIQIDEHPSCTIKTDWVLVD